VVSVPLEVIVKAGPQPMPELQMLLTPPYEVFPYKFPSVPMTNPATGTAPSGQPLWEQKLYIVFNSPCGLIL